MLRREVVAIAEKDPEYGRCGTCKHYQHLMTCGECRNGSRYCFDWREYEKRLQENHQSSDEIPEWCAGLDLEEWYKKYENLDGKDITIYLHGCCSVWVNEHYRRGDKCIAILEEREGIKTKCLMHACLFRKGKYVDVRGGTEDFDDVIDAFDYGEFEVVEFGTLEEFNTLMKNIGVK